MQWIYHNRYGLLIVVCLNWIFLSALSLNSLVAQPPLREEVEQLASTRCLVHTTPLSVTGQSRSTDQSTAAFERCVDSVYEARLNQYGDRTFSKIAVVFGPPALIVLLFFTTIYALGRKSGREGSWI